MKTVNPHNHQYPHAKIDNVQLTSISRLRKSPERRLPMVGDPKEHPRDPYYSNRHEREIYARAMRDKHRAD